MCISACIKPLIDTGILARINLFKGFLRKKCTEAEADGVHEGLPGDFRATTRTRDQLINWIAEVWEYLSEETIISGFRKANVISATQLADHVEQSVEIQASITDTLIGALANLNIFNLNDC